MYCVEWEVIWKGRDWYLTVTLSDLYFTVILLAAVEDRGKGNESEGRVISEGASVGDGLRDDL